MIGLLFSGLQARYYDACIGWSPTVERIHMGSFSVSFLNPEESYFFYKDENNKFATDNFNGKKIGMQSSCTLFLTI